MVCSLFLKKIFRFFLIFTALLKTRIISTSTIHLKNKISFVHVPHIKEISVSISNIQKIKIKSIYFLLSKINEFMYNKQLTISETQSDIKSA